MAVSCCSGEPPGQIALQEKEDAADRIRRQRLDLKRRYPPIPQWWCGGGERSKWSRRPSWAAAIEPYPVGVKTDEARCC